MKKQLTPIENGTRKSIIWRLHDIGYGVVSIANIMNTTHSTISRVIDKKPAKRKKVTEAFLFNIPIDGE